MFQVLKSGQSLAHSSSSTFKLNWDVPSKNRHILIFVKLMYRNHLNKFLTKKSTLP